MTNLDNTNYSDGENLSAITSGNYGIHYIYHPVV